MRQGLVLGLITIITITRPPRGAELSGVYLSKNIKFQFKKEKQKGQQ